MRNTRATQLLFELSKPGRRATYLPRVDVPELPLAELLPREALAASPPPLPELSELDLVRHFTNLSTQNMSVDTHFYPLGSCTMKYNPKRNERLASLPGLVDLHPYQNESTLQGMLELLYGLQEILAEISGLPRRFASAGRRRARRADGPAGGGGAFSRRWTAPRQGACARSCPRHEPG